MDSVKIPENLGDNVDDEDDSIEDYLENFPEGQIEENYLGFPNFQAINSEKKSSLFEKVCRSSPIKESKIIKKLTCKYKDDSHLYWKRIQKLEIEKR